MKYSQDILTHTQSATHMFLDKPSICQLYLAEFPYHPQSVSLNHPGCKNYAQVWPRYIFENSTFFQLVKGFSQEY